MTLQKYDWELVRVQYVQGKDNGSGVEWPTLEHLAQEYDIPAATIRSRAHRENWSGQRSDFHTSLIHRIREKTLEQLSDKAAQLDVQVFSVARAALALHSKELIEGIQSGELSLAERERLLRMCDMAHRMGRRALGIGSTWD